MYIDWYLILQPGYFCVVMLLLKLIPIPTRRLSNVLYLWSLEGELWFCLIQFRKCVADITVRFAEHLH